MLTVAQIMALGPCYMEGEVEDLIGDGKSLIEICELDIPAVDRVWVLTRLCPSSVREKASEQITERVIRRFCACCEIPEVREWAIRWLDGTDRSTTAASRALKWIVSPTPGTYVIRCIVECAGLKADHILRASFAARAYGALGYIERLTERELQVADYLAALREEDHA